MRPFGLGPSAIADEVGLDKATVTRLLRTLVEAGDMRQDPITKKYKLTGKLIRMAQGVAVSLDLQRVAWPHLLALRDRVGETVGLGVLEDQPVYYVDKLESENSIRRVSAIGQTMPLHTTVLGKAILAVLLDSEREAKYRQIDFLPRTERTICEVATLREEIRKTQARGYAIDDCANEPLATCVAAAMIGADGRPVEAISVSAPHFRIQDHIRALGVQVVATAAQVTWGLGAIPSVTTHPSGGTQRETESATRQGSPVR